MDENNQYSVRDPRGNVYGPASEALLRQWVGEGRIVAGMAVRGEGATEWIEASVHPVVADLFQGGGGTIPQSTPSARLYNVQAEIKYAVAPRSSGMATASLVLGIVALVMALPTYPIFCCCGVSIPLGVVGSILGFVELAGRNDMNGSSNRKKAMAGVVLSILAIVIALGIVGLGIAVGVMKGGFRIGP